MNKKTALNAACLLVAVLTLVLLFFFRPGKKAGPDYDDGIEIIDPDTIYLTNSKVEVRFSDVLLSPQKETRKLIVSEQIATVSTELTQNMIKILQIDALKKSQTVTYEGRGYFVVDLDNLTKRNVVEDKENHIVTILIDHAYLQAVEIDPNKIIIDEVKEGLLARGDIKLTVKDYNEIEKELRTRLEDKFNTAKNGQEANETALRMVKEIYEPIVKAIDSRYTLQVAFIQES